MLGFAGLVGAGRTDVGLALFGIEPADEGVIVFEGRQVAITSPQQAVDLQIAYVTEDRRQLGADVAHVHHLQHYAAHAAPAT